MAIPPPIGAMTRVVAHRGMHAPAGPVDNSLGAFRSALDAGADALELDVRRTRDGVLVVHHDPAVAGSTTSIRNLDFAQLPKLPDGQHVPTLDEVVGLATAGNSRLVVELKEGGYEREVVDALRTRMAPDGFELISFSSGSVRAVKAVDPALRAGYLAPKMPTWLRESALYPAAVWMLDRAGWHPALNVAARAGADYVSVDKRLATPTFLAEAAKRSVPVDVWTVNDAPTMQRLLASGVQSLVTDDAALGVRLRNAAQGAPAPALAPGSTVRAA
ncbi:MAG: Glycerophosphoryl diester phosphodiesterase [Thermoleophilia bacterium]|nr:Glycerophosphoryl diester phosphodiesterase [Thermoleophilia bacterium]MCZ4497091.1 Glycerophosphoryl diester phosphodiesterase [Thermoleophilia bacterium]